MGTRRLVRTVAMFLACTALASLLVPTPVWSYPAFVGAPMLVLVLLFLTAYYFLAQGKRWARSLVLWTAPLGLIGLVMAIGERDTLTRTMLVLSGLEAVLVLVFLNRPSVKACFSIDDQPRPLRHRLFRWGLAIVASIVVLAGLVAAMTWWVLRMNERSNIWVQEAGIQDAWTVSEDGNNCCPSFSPDGGRILYIHRSPRGGCELRIYNLRDHHTHVAMKATSVIMSATWAPDGNRVAYVESDSSADGTRHSLRTLSLEGPERTQLDVQGATILSPAWSPDGQRIAFIGPDEGLANQLWIVRSDGDSLRKLTLGGSMVRAVHRFAWSSDARRILFLRGDSLRLTSPQGDETPMRPFDRLGGFGELVCAPWASDTIVVAALDQMRAGVYLISLVTGDLRSWWPRREFLDRDLTVAPDGRRVAFTRQGRQRSRAN